LRRPARSVLAAGNKLIYFLKYVYDINVLSILKDCKSRLLAILIIIYDYSHFLNKKTQN